MAKYAVTPTGVESPFGEEEIIVSKTDPKGRLNYVNDVFLRVSRYRLKDLLGQPHSIIRHPKQYVNEPSQNIATYCWRWSPGSRFSATVKSPMTALRIRSSGT